MENPSLVELSDERSQEDITYCKSQRGWKPVFYHTGDTEINTPGLVHTETRQQRKDNRTNAILLGKEFIN